MKLNIVLIEVQGEANVGSIARLVRNFNIDHLGGNLILINPEFPLYFNDSLNPEIIKMAMHGKTVLDNIILLDSLDEVLAESTTVIGTTAISGISRNVLRNTFPADRISELPLTGTVSILFGRESSGLSNEELNKCDFVINIPTNQEYPTLNISHAAGIIFYEIFRTLELFEQNQKVQPARISEKKLLVEIFDSLLDHIPYPDFKKNIASRVFKNIIGRAFITEREFSMLIGVFRSIKNYIIREKDII